MARFYPYTGLKIKVKINHHASNTTPKNQAISQKPPAQNITTTKKRAPAIPATPGYPYGRVILPSGKSKGRAWRLNER
jgi:hypothetical protein